MIIFTRIAKTGSTSVCRGFPMKTGKRPEEILKRYKSQKYIDRGKKLPNTPKFLDGHHPYGIHKMYRTKDVSYFTFLRKPIDRWLSSFYYCREKTVKTRNVLKEFYEDSSSPIDFLDRCIEAGINENVTTRQLSGIEDINNIISGVYTPYCCLNRKRYSEDEMSAFLESSKNVIMNKYDFVGLFENLNADFDKLKSFYKIKKASLPKKKTRSTKRDGYLDINDSRIMARLEELNKFDIQLYDFYLRKYKK